MTSICLTCIDTVQCFDYTSIQSSHWSNQCGSKNHSNVYEKDLGYLVSIILICINLLRCNSYQSCCNRLQVDYKLYSGDLAFRNHYHLGNCSCPLPRRRLWSTYRNPLWFPQGEHNSHLSIVDLKCTSRHYIFRRCCCSRDTSIANLKCRKNPMVRRNSINSHSRLLIGQSFWYTWVQERNHGA